MHPAAPGDVWATNGNARRSCKNSSRRGAEERGQARGAHLIGTGFARIALGPVAHAFGSRDAHEHRLRFDQGFEMGERFALPRQGLVRTARLGVASMLSSSVPSGKMWNRASNSALQNS